MFTSLYRMDQVNATINNKNDRGINSNSNIKIGHEGIKDVTKVFLKKYESNSSNNRLFLR